VAVVGYNALGRDSVPEHGIPRVYSLSAKTDRSTAEDPQLSAEILRKIGEEVAQSLVFK
jgi:glycerate kinase